jgi:Tol biopolymer transport system component
VLLVRAFGYGEGAGSDRFVDDDGSVFEADIERLAAAGVTLGCNPPINDRFCPDDVVHRDQAASFLGRALKLTPLTPLPSTEVVASVQSAAQSDLWVVSIDGEQRRRLTDTADVLEFDPVWSPDRRWVAYSASTGEQQTVEVMAADGSETLTVGSGREPSWSPTGDELAFVDDTSNVLVAAADGSNPTVIFSSGLVTPMWIEWSDTGDLLAFTVVHVYAAGAEFFVEVMQSDGEQVTTLVGWSGDFRPGTSTLAYGKGCADPNPDDSFSGGQLVTVDPDGAGEIALTEPGEDTCELHPAWSPDGSTVAFIRTTDTTPQVWTVDARGTSPAMLVADGYSSVAWTPDGTGLVLLTEAPEVFGYSLRRLTVDGGGTVEILNDVTTFDVWD